MAAEPAVPTAAGPNGPAAAVAAENTLQALLSRGRVRGLLAMLGPAFVAAVAYVDPGNFATNAGYSGEEVVARITGQSHDEGFDALDGRYGNMIEMGIIDPLRVTRSALQNGASVAGLLLTTNTLIAEEQTPWGGSPSLMTQFGPLDDGLNQPSPDASTPQSLGLGPSVG